MQQQKRRKNINLFNLKKISYIKKTHVKSKSPNRSRSETKSIQEIRSFKFQQQHVLLVLQFLPFYTNPHQFRIHEGPLSVTETGQEEEKKQDNIGSPQFSI